MKRIVYMVILLMISILSINVSYASSATTYTMTIDSKGNFVRTQDAYLPETVLTTLGLNKPEDMMFDDNDMLWIADTGNKRIIEFDTFTNTINKVIDSFFIDRDGEIETYNFKEPRGVFISNRGLYVADTGANAVYRMTTDGELIEEPFVSSPYAPNKLVVDNRGNIYVYGEGASNGIVQLSNKDEFLGFFTTNKVKLTLLQQFYKRILSQEQFDRLAIRSPQTFSSIFIDKNSMIYTTTASTTEDAIKKHNMQGGNIFNNTISQPDSKDIYVDSEGIIYAGMSSGAIYVYDASGNYIFSFGVSNEDSGKLTEDIAGIFSKLSAIAVRKDGNIYALDSEKAFLQSFSPTAYSKGIYNAIKLYETREYEKSIEAWDEVLRLNQMSIIAHNNIAKSYLQLENYEKAQEHFKLAGNRDGYSESYWEVRNVVIQNTLGAIIIAGVLVYLLSKALKLVNNKTNAITNFMEPIKKPFRKKLGVDLLYTFRVMKHPSDSFYELKRKNKGSLLAAIIIYLLTFVFFIYYSSGKGFIYQMVSAEDLDLTALVLGYFLLTILFVVANYLDTSLHDGVGNIKQIFIMFSYSLGPIAIALLTTALLSHVLTYNETFFLDLIMMFGSVWTAILVFLGIVETHDYSGKKAIKSILMTILFILVIIIVILIVITMWKQLSTFIELILKELIRNVVG
ncbi:MAG: YIP1 family protein [Acholeplasma sp.]|nr:YIP1 family protein [Acholeplasma sp.]